MVMCVRILMLVLGFYSFTAWSTEEMPVFDNDENSVIHRGVDLTPPVPILSDFDRQVLRLCGPLDSWIERESFSRFVRQENGQIFRQMFRDVNGLSDAAVVSDAQLNEFLDEFEKVWWSVQGFKHIFCGELRRDRQGVKLGGLHYVGRYVQLAESGQMRQLSPEKCGPETQEGLVYTFGMSLVTADGEKCFKCKNGYGYRLDAYNSFVEGMRAFRILASSQKKVCRYRIDSEGGSYWTVAVARGDALRTFFTVQLNARTCQRNTTVCDPVKGVYRQTVEQCLALIGKN